MIVRPRGPTNFGAFLNHTDEYCTHSICSGWDPIFEYEGKTFAEMTKEDKVKFSQWEQLYIPCLFTSH